MSAGCIELVNVLSSNGNFSNCFPVAIEPLSDNPSASMDYRTANIDETPLS